MLPFDSIALIPSPIFQSYTRPLSCSFSINTDPFVYAWQEAGGFLFLHAGLIVQVEGRVLVPPKYKNPGWLKKIIKSYYEWMNKRFEETKEKFTKKW